MANLKNINIEQLSDTGVLVLTADKTAKIYGQVSEYWERVANIYSLYKIEIADQMIEEELGDEYLLDVEMCREYLLGEQEQENKQANKEAVNMYHSVFESLDAIES